MGFMDDMKGKMSGMSDDMRNRYEELKNMEEQGQLDDRGRQELQELREKMNM